MKLSRFHSSIDLYGTVCKILIRANKSDTYMPSAKPAITVRFEHSEYLRIVEAADKVQRTPANYVAVAVRRMLGGGDLQDIDSAVPLSSSTPQGRSSGQQSSEEIGVIGSWVGGRRGEPGSYLKQAMHAFEEGNAEYAHYDPNEELIEWLDKGVSHYVAVLMAKDDCSTNGVYAWTPMPESALSTTYRADLDFEWRLRLGSAYPEAKEAVDEQCAKRGITGWDPPSIETEWMERGKKYRQDMGLV